MLAMLRQFGDLGANQQYRGSSRAGYAGQEDAGDPQRDESLAPLQLEALLQSTTWPASALYSSGPPHAGQLNVFSITGLAVGW